jgi:hypothetical protein
MTLYFLFMFSKTKSTVVLLCIVLISVYQPHKSKTLTPLASVMSQDLALQQDATTISANLRTSSINVTSPLTIHFPFLHPSELLIIVLTILFSPSIKF